MTHITQCWYVTWHRIRNEAETYLGTRLTPGNIVTMLSSKRNWHIVDDLAHKIMSHKEAEERKRQTLPDLTTEMTS
ncbi:Retrovirus-related Pol polyprotein from type-1 retrotransposable element R1 2 [Aphis craccivora]|uniref:Retrovirus-related Pol polyprotein from type-1 retrotransposable element R1 2 n=1 Tax=Aphis craccivora TaxID=307492 RepID=A0A6G0Y2N9_APHCR|nr:Retrovirus-related Pol polyprotein from type-1 retrotransposable element R1 2 [Aphis craccivora]